MILCYLLPLIILNILYSRAESEQDLWNITSLGLLLAFAGTLFIFWMMIQREALFNAAKQQSPKPDIVPAVHPSEKPSPIETIEYQNICSALEEAQVMNHQLRSEIEDLTKQLQEDNVRQEKFDQQNLEFEEFRRASLDQLEHQQRDIHELHDVNAEQKNVIEKRQQQINHLETKVSDLTYEIKTLLKLAETNISNLGLDSSSNMTSFRKEGEGGGFAAVDEPVFVPGNRQINTPEEASLQLKRCLDIAQKITGSYRFNSHTSHFAEGTTDSFTIDLRRLSDRLRIENSCTILLYSPKENQVLFVNNQIKIALGWNPEIFIQNFNEILQNSNAWRQGISSLSTRSEAQIQLPFKTKSGTESLLHVHLAMIPTGIFRQYIMVILY